MTPLQRQLDQQEIASLRQMTGASPQGSSGGIPQATANDMAAMNARGAQQRIQAAGVQLPDWWLQMQEESNRHYGGQGGPTPLMDQNLSEFGGLQGAERHFTQNLRRW